MMSDQAFNPVAVLENCVAMARNIQGVSGLAYPNTIVLRPGTAIQVWRRDPSLLPWVKGRDELYAPTYTDRAGHTWHVDITENLVPRRVEKFVGPLDRRMVASTRESSR